MWDVARAASPLSRQRRQCVRHLRWRRVQVGEPMVAQRPPPRQCALSPPPPAGAVRPLPSSSTAFSPPHRGPDLLWLQRGAIPWCGTCGLCVKAALAQCSGGGSGAGAVVVAQEHEDVVSATAVCGCDCTCFYDCSSVSFSTWRMFGVCRVPGQTLGKAFFAESLFPECMTPSVFRPSPSASGT
jgi:hypothetical protein